MALLHVNFFSNVLGMCMDMDVILPQKTSGQIGMEGKGGTGYCPTLYLLHGMSDNHTIWQRRTSIERYVADKGLAVVMPTVHLGWYTDMQHGLPYWTFISQELPAICRELFPQLSPRREDTFVAGLSMGGYGALKCGLGAPETFSACAALSAATDAVEIATNRDHPVFRNVFGSPERTKGSADDLFALAERLTQQRPRVYMWCGTEDFLYQQNVRMRAHLESLGYDLTYEESPGDHQWKYWDEKIQTVLQWLGY